jgi:hypothetical protein
MSEKTTARRGTWLLVLLLGSACFYACGVEPEYSGEVQQGDLSMRGGSPTVRAPYEPEPDDPLTTNDESNDQPVGHFGTMTLRVTGESGNTYTIDGELEGLELRRLYFPRGGWVDFWSCELDEDFSGTCFDEESRTWTIHGEA